MKRTPPCDPGGSPIANRKSKIANPLPLIGVTLGDPAGIGPEIVLRALADPVLRGTCRLAVFGEAALLREAAARLGLDAPFVEVAAPDPLRRDCSAAQVRDIGACPPDTLFAARPTPEGGAASVRYLEAAADAAAAGLVDAIATAPLNKIALGMAGSPYTGHTTLLRDRFASPDAVMMLVGGGLRVALVTVHIALADVPHAISTEGIVATTTAMAESLRRYFGLPEPRVAVCGLNPHASDGSRFGNEELRLIEPAVVELRGRGVNVQGPVPPDTCFWRAKQGEFDGVVAMYHDQGLIPLKLLAFDSAVNVTLGLPIIRTSVDHGTAYEIAGHGAASPQSLLAAIRLAASMSEA
ncbi:4-hydroxythreonine-4-phosphate dehydrogenase PdxA [bacterium]|nr:4-hydroxythreonine-4-phosphate dehydrogenase PdxA [bacterium]